MKSGLSVRLYPILSAGLLITTAVVSVRGGDLNPPGGPVNPTMKTLEDVEPRTPISAIPFTISQSGSYYLTGNFTGTSGQNGITIAASSVRLDLKGFTLRGIPGSLHGVAVTGLQTNIWIGHGNIRGWGGAGVMMLSARRSTCSDVQTDENECGVVAGEDTDTMAVVATSNRSDGIVTSNQSSADECSAIGNGGDGFRFGPRSKISNCLSSDNVGGGIVVGDGSTVDACTAGSNGGVGISAGSGAPPRGSTITGCTASSNGGHGIAAGSSSQVSHCASSGNNGDGIVVGIGGAIHDCVARANTNDGIECGANAMILQNNCTDNGSGPNDGAGIHVIAPGGGSRIEANNVVSNDRGIDVDSTGNLIIRNSASGTGVPYDIVAGNSVGAIINVVGNGSFSTTNCFANLFY